MNNLTLDILLEILKFIKGYKQIKKVLVTCKELFNKNNQILWKSLFFQHHKSANNVASDYEKLYVKYSDIPVIIQWFLGTTCKINSSSARFNLRTLDEAFSFCKSIQRLDIYFKIDLVIPPEIYLCPNLTHLEITHDIYCIMDEFIIPYDHFASLKVVEFIDFLPNNDIFKLSKISEVNVVIDPGYFDVTDELERMDFQVPVKKEISYSCHGHPSNFRITRI